MIALKKVAEDRRTWNWHDETRSLTDAGLGRPLPTNPFRRIAV
jgi:hypothetical protein